MNETSLVSAIDALASKLGVAASEVYRVLIAQARVSAIKSGIVLVLMLALIALAVRITRKVFKNWGKVEYDAEFGVVLFVAVVDCCAFVAIFFRWRGGFKHHFRIDESPVLGAGLYSVAPGLTANFKATL